MNMCSTALGQNALSASSLRLKFGTNPNTRNSVAHKIDENTNPFLQSPTPGVLTDTTDIENMGPTWSPTSFKNFKILSDSQGTQDPPGSVSNTN